MTDDEVIILANQLVNSLGVYNEDKENFLSIALFVCWRNVDLCRKRGIRPLKSNLWLAMRNECFRQRTVDRKQRALAKSTEESTEPNPSAAMELKELFGFLTPEQQQLLQWKYVEKLTLRQIAKKLGVTWQAVWDRLGTAKKRLRRRIDKAEMGDRG